MAIDTFFKGFPYPIVDGPQGYLGSSTGVALLKSNLLILLLTNPGERCMLPDYGTPLNTLLFDPNDATVAIRARQMIIDSITQWEPRIVVDAITVSNKADRTALSEDDNLSEVGSVLTISIQFRDPVNITETISLDLEVPLSGS
jgi:uncharacterized protein